MGFIPERLLMVARNSNVTKPRSPRSMPPRNDKQQWLQVIIIIIIIVH